MEEEDANYDKNSGLTMGECLEYMLKEKIFEVFCSYIATDKPTGFLPRGIDILG